MLTYSAKDFKGTWGPIDLSKGSGPGTFLEIAPLGDLIEETFSAASGEMAVSKLSNQGALITYTAMQGAPVNAELADVALAQMAIGASIPAFPFIVEGATAGSDWFVCQNAVLKSRPTQTYADKLGEQSWVWVCGIYYSAPDRSTFLSNYRNYVDFDITV